MIAPDVDAADSDFDRKIGHQLRLARKRRGLTLADVERISAGEFRHSALGAYERGTRTLSVPRLERLAALYATSVSELLPGDAPETAAPETAAVDDDAPPPPVRPTRRADDRPDGFGARRLHIDLTALEQTTADVEPLRRYVESIRRQRGGLDAGIVTLRGDDLHPVASLCGMDAIDAVLWLHSLGVLSRPNGEVLGGFG